MTLKRENWGDKFGKRLKKAKVRRMKATEKKDQVKKPQVIKGTEGVVHKNPSSKPSVVARKPKARSLEQHISDQFDASEKFMARTHKQVVGGNRVMKTISHPHPEHKGSSVVAHKLK